MFTWVERTELTYTVPPSNKFYNVILLTDGKQWQVQRDWGRIGAAGTTETNTYALEKTARSAQARIIGEKQAKGYKLVGAHANNAPVQVTPAPNPKANLADRLVIALYELTNAAGQQAQPTRLLVDKYHQAQDLLVELGLPGNGK